MSEHDTSIEKLFASDADERLAVEAAQELIEFNKKWPDAAATRIVGVSGRVLEYQTDKNRNIVARDVSQLGEEPRVIGVRTSEQQDIGIG